MKVKEKKWSAGKRILFGSILFAVLFLVIPGTGKAAAYGELGNGKKMFAYPLSKKVLTIYSDEELTQEADRVAYCEYEILQMSGGKAFVRYKTAEGKKGGYVSADKFLCDPDYEKTGAFVYKSAGMYLYKNRSVKKSQRYIRCNYRSGGITLGVKGKYMQMMMERKGKFYLGWITYRTFKKTIYGSALHTDQILADGTYTVVPRRKKTEEIFSGKFELKYQGNGMYSLKNTEDSHYLGIGEERAVLLVRAGAYFYLRSGSGELGLNYMGRTVKAADVKKQQFELKKIYRKPTQKNAVIYSQYHPEIGGMVYQNGYEGARTIASSGCGLISLVNAIYALNGEYLPPDELVKFSVSRGHYFYNQGTADTLYPDVARKWGKTYHFRHAGKTTSFTTLRKHLQKKGTAVALVPGHYIAIVAYRKSDKKYLVLDSAVSGSRPTSIYGDWKSAYELQSGRLYCEYFHMFSAR